MNGKPRPDPTTTTIAIFDLVQMRVDLEQIKVPSTPIKESIEILDNIIHNFVTSLQGNR